MGYEWALKVKLSDRAKLEVERLLITRTDYVGKSISNGQAVYEFGKLNTNKHHWPNLVVAFDEQGLYICHSMSSKQWKDLQDLKEYLLQQKLDFELVEL